MHSKLLGVPEWPCSAFIEALGAPSPFFGCLHFSDATTSLLGLANALAVPYSELLGPQWRSGASEPRRSILDRTCFAGSDAKSRRRSISPLAAEPTPLPSHRRRCRRS